MNYRLTTVVKPLIWVEAIVEKFSHSRVEFMIKVSNLINCFYSIFRLNLNLNVVLQPTMWRLLSPSLETPTLPSSKQRLELPSMFLKTMLLCGPSRVSQARAIVVTITSFVAFRRKRVLDESSVPFAVRCQRHIRRPASNEDPFRDSLLYNIRNSSKQ